MDVRMVRRRLGSLEPPRARRGRRPRDGAPQLRDHGPHWAASEGPIATAMNEKPKAVFSRTLEKAEWGPAEIFGGDLAAAIAELKARDDEGTILVHGGPDFAQSLTRVGLVDEYQLTMVPIAIGAGRSPFADLTEHLKLDVVEEERFKSGALAQILVPRPASRPRPGSPVPAARG